MPHESYVRVDAALGEAGGAGGVALKVAALKVDILLDLPWGGLGQQVLVVVPSRGLFPADHDVAIIGNILEVGAGTGILTDYAVDLELPIVIVEKDPHLARFLELRYKNYEVEIIMGDIIDVIEAMGQRGNYFIYSNLPYNISSSFTGSIIDMVDFSGSTHGFMGAVIMYQKEFAERLMAVYSSRKYGKISVTFQNKMEWCKIIDVPRNKFTPIPKVDSVVLMMKPRKVWKEIPNDHDLYMKLLNRSFSSRRKKLKNLLTPSKLGMNISSEEVRNMLEDRNWSDIRPENLSPDDFITISNIFFEMMER